MLLSFYTSKVTRWNLLARFLSKNTLTCKTALTFSLNTLRESLMVLSFPSSITHNNPSIFRAAAAASFEKSSYVNSKLISLIKGNILDAVKFSQA
jgi:hypothetical protein